MPDALETFAELMGSELAKIEKKYNSELAVLRVQHKAELAELEKRLAQVEARGVRYRGLWQRAEDYNRGDCTTCDGSFWIALVDRPAQKPGNRPEWQLCSVPGTRSR